MYLTRKADYAIRCVLILSSQKNKIANVTEVAEQMDIPKNFLAKIVQQLVKAGILASIRGINGGFKLAKETHEINLLDVIETVEGPLGMNRCVIDKRRCNFSNLCPVHPIWIELRALVVERLKSVDFSMLASGDEAFNKVYKNLK